MKVAIMQPTYLPWAGYFRLIARVDHFVYLDDAQYERGSWHLRNRVLVGGRAHWLTVPVRRQHLGENLDRVQVDDRRDWRRKHLALLEQSYARHPYRRALLEAIAPIADRALTTLADLNIALIERCCLGLGIATPRSRASSLDVSGKRTARVAALCERLGATRYLSPPGARDYLAADGFTENTRVALEFAEFTPPPYPQPSTAEFISHLSIADVLASLGWAGAVAHLASSAPESSP